MSFRATGLLAAATLALAAFVYFHEIRGEAGRGADTGKSERLFAELEPERIESIEIVAPGGERVRALREGPAWRIVEPISAPGEAKTLNAMARTLAELVPGGRIADPVAPSVYGLSDSKVQVIFAGGDHEYALEIGRETPLGGSVYVSVVGSGRQGEVLTIPVSAASRFDRGLAELRDRHVLEFSPAYVSRLSLSVPGPSGFAAELERSGDGWQIVSPAALEADARAVDRLLSDLSLLRAEAFVDEPGESERRALLRPSFVAVVQVGELPLRFELAASRDGDDHLRLARGREGRFYRVRDALVAHFPRRLFALRAKQVTHFDKRLARAMRVDFGSGASVRVDPDEEIVSLLSELDAIDIVAEALGPAERAALGLEPARVRIRVLGPEDRVLADLRLGRLEAGRGIFARADDAETIHLLDASLDSRLPATPEQWKPQAPASTEGGGD